MDYRLSGILADCTYRGSTAKRTADALRAESTDATEVDHAREVQIARAQARAEVYDLIGAQLKSFEFDQPGGNVPAQAPPLASGGKAEDCGIGKLRGGCSGCLSVAQEIQENFTAMCREVRNYGWSDSDAQRYYNKLDNLIPTHVRDLQSHR